MRRAIVIAATVLVVSSGAPIARGCSCATPDPRRALARADGAFLGTLVAQPDPDAADDRGNVPWEFRVERAVKGSMAEIVTVWGGPDGNTCGIAAQVGRRIGMFLGRDGQGRWTGGLCSEVDPDELLRATEPLPAPDGQGPPAFVVGGELGDVAVVALDEQGRTLAYGPANGEPRSLAVCPGGARTVEVAATTTPKQAVVVVRDLPSLAAVWTKAVDHADSWPRAVGCGDAEAADVYAVFETASRPTSVGIVLRVRRDEAPARVWEGRGAVAAFDPGGRFALLAEASPPTLVRIELPSGQVRTVAALPEAAAHIAVDPSGRRVAAVGHTDTYESGSYAARPPRLMVRGTGGGEEAERVLDTIDSTRSLLWASADTVTVTRTGQRGELVESFDGRLRPRGAWGPWPGVSTAARAGLVHGVGYDGKLRRAHPATGRPVVVRDLPGRHLVTIVAVPRARPARRAATTTTTTAPTTTTTTSTTVAPTPTPTTEAAQVALQPSSSDRDRPGAMGGLAGLALVGVSAATTAVLRRRPWLWRR